LGRMTIVPYFPLDDETMRTIIKLQLGRIESRVKQNHRASFAYDDGVIQAIQSRCKEVESGARNVDHILTGTLLPEISQQFLAYMAEGKTIERVHVGVG